MRASGPRRGRIVVVGSYNRDLGIALDRFPRPGETVLAQELAVAHGGKGSNQAVQAARCGAPVAIIAALGTDAEGAAALALWSAEGIEASGVRRAQERPTGTAVILVDGAGENQIVVVSGANAVLDAATVERAAGTGLFQDAALVVAQLETPAEATLAAFRAGHAAGARTLLNTAPATAPRPPALLQEADIVVANEGEAALITGLPAQNGARALAESLRQRLRDGATAIVTAGGEGAWLAGPEMPQGLHQPALPVTVVDATGAGDAFVGAFAAAIALGTDMPAALQRGVAAGSLACRRRGAVPSLPQQAEIDATLHGGIAAQNEQREETNG